VCAECIEKTDVIHLKIALCYSISNKKIFFIFCFLRVICLVASFRRDELEERDVHEECI
jgi:hypothetical protein